MSYLIKIKVDKGRNESNTVLLNLDNIIDIERINNRIHFTLIGNKERIGEWPDAEAAETFFDKIYTDF